MHVDKLAFNEELKPFLTSLLSVLLIFLVLIIITGKVGIDTSSIVAALAAASFAVVMTLQGSLGNIAVGILLLIFKHYKNRDYNTVGDQSGFVEEIEIINTIIKNLDNELLIIPNGTAISDVIINSSGGDGYICQELIVNMPYNESFDKLESTILNAVKATAIVPEDPPTELETVNLILNL